MKKSILKIKSKIIIFHAEDDWFIPHTHSVELLKLAETYRPKEYGKVELITYGKEHGLGHFVHQHEPLYLLIK